ncbi:hypothetical protein KUH32_03565 [Thalassococcus sp. CAU 1522]|uniref:Uncharacterized protein n=1 Tax=Thalassococcus arenae TaxID=2851652 RepID=A0ABS6N494_9RHOB|nr:hypothetical protein [Thalassococcus arenae]MBV2358841.1 hypothetical protein [Thalassococcus arenae]
MTVALDTPRRIGPVWIAALTQQIVRAKRLDHALLCHGGKRPVALLVARPGDVALAFRPDGTPLSADQIDHILPGAQAAFRDAVAAASAPAPGR